MYRIKKHTLWGSATAGGTGLVSSAVPIKNLIGDAIGMYVVLAGTTPVVDITLTVCDTENGTFLAPYDNAGTAIGSVASNLNATRWIQFTPVMAPWIKITVTPDGGSGDGGSTTVKAYLILQEDI